MSRTVFYKFVPYARAYDVVAIVEGPSNEAAMQSLFTVGMAGAVKTETLVAFPAEKGIELIKKLP